MNDTDNLVGDNVQVPMPDIATNIQRYVRIRDDLDRKRKEYQEFEKEAKYQLDQISMQIMTVADQLGVENFKTEYGTAYRNVKQSYTVQNWDEYIEWAEKTGNLHTIQKRVTKTAVDEIVDETGEIPPGLDLYTEVTFNIRRS
jgi:hypothetical protein